MREGKYRYYLLNPPKFKSDGKGLLKVAFETFKRNSKNQLSQLILIDCSDLNIPEKGYADSVHLNAVGGGYFSHLVKTKGWSGIHNFCSVFTDGS